MMAHITDFRESKDDQRFTLAAYTDSEVIFHTDVGDVVSLFALGEPASGGESQIASGWKVYNELAQSRPDLIHTLADNWLIPRYVYSLPSRILKGNSYADMILLYVWLVRKVTP